MALSLTPAFPVTYVANADGRANLHTDGEALHSTRDPQREAHRSAAGILSSLHAGERLILAGIGWGYVLEELHALAPDQLATMIFFEPSAKVLALLEEHGRLRDLRNLGPRLVTDDAAELRAVLASSSGSYRIEVLPAYGRRFPDLGRQLKEFLQSGPEERAPGTDVDSATRARFLRQWTRNAFCRLALSADVLEFPRKPPAPRPDPATAALYCGAGPRLVEDLQLLPSEFLQSTPVIAADTALAPLLALGIRPDLVVCVDSGRGTYYHFAAAAALVGPGALLDIPVLTHLAGPSFLRLWFRRIVFYRSTTPLDQLLGSGAGALADVPEWNNPPRNAIGPALHCARAAGARTVWTAGTSFRSDGGRSHVRGTGYTEFARATVHRTRSLEMYRPGGYRSELTAKNELAVAGIEALARELQLTVRAAGDAARDDFHIFAAPGPDLDQTFTARVPAAALRTHLQRSFDNWNFAEWQNLGIARKDLTRWLSMLS